jgi:ribosomal protein L22
MSIRIPTRRLGQPTVFNTFLLPYHTRRPISTRKPKPAPPVDDSKALQLDKKVVNPVLESYLQAEYTRSKKETKGDLKRPELEQGSLTKDSILSDVIPNLTPEKVDSLSELVRKDEAIKRKGDEKALAAVEGLRAERDTETPKPRREIPEREKDLMRMKLDPDPLARQRWERRAVIRSLRRRGRLTKPQLIMRTERESTYQSPFLATSVKKLTKLMRQIAGKTVEDALIQMRFSKKKVAKDVMTGLQIARDRAIAARGMGMGGVTGEAGKKKIEVELKDGKKLVVDDPTRIYIDQAWVGKGRMTKEVEYRARGQVNLLRHRTTCFSILLKEEKTRLRISEEIKKKRDNRKLWVALPDRPITSQRQYCLW